MTSEEKSQPEDEQSETPTTPSKPDFSNAIYISDIMIRGKDGEMHSVEYPTAFEFVPPNKVGDNYKPIDFSFTDAAMHLEITVKPDLIVRDGNRTAFVQIGDGLKDDESED